MPQRQLGWATTKSGEEKRRFRAYQVRKSWDDQVTDIETDNREAIKQRLAGEDLRRLNAKPEPAAPDGLPLCEIPRCLIEITPEQQEELGPAPPGANGAAERTTRADTSLEDQIFEKSRSNGSRPGCLAGHQERANEWIQTMGY